MFNDSMRSLSTKSPLGKTNGLSGIPSCIPENESLSVPISLSDHLIQFMLDVISSQR